MKKKTIIHNFNKSNHYKYYWFALGAQPHLKVPGVTGGREMCFSGASAAHPLKYKGT